MAARYPHMHCHVMTWIESQDRALAELMRQLCLVQQLSPRFGRGVTFVMPGKEARAEILKAGYGEGTTEQAVRLLQAHILPFYLPKGEDFAKQAAAGGLGSRAGVALELKKAAGEAVTLADGTKLTPAKSFRPLPRADEPRVAVWETDGALPLEGGAFDLAAALRRRKTEGGADGAAGRAALAAQVEGAAQASGSLLPYYDAVLGLMQCLAASPALAGDLRRAVAALSASGCASFYVLVEPYKVGGGHYLSDAAIAAWGGRPAQCENAAQALLELFNGLQTLGEKTGGGAVYSNPGAVRAELAPLREKLLSSASLGSGAEVAALYRQITSANAVGGVAGLWPADVAAALGNGVKLWQDLLRFNLRIYEAEVMKLQQGADVSAKMLQLARSLFPGSDYGREVSSFVSAPASLAAPNDKISHLMNFVNSSDFVYFPCSLKMVGGVVGGSPDADPFSGAPPWNAERSSVLVARRMSALGKAPAQADALRALYTPN